MEKEKDDDNEDAKYGYENREVRKGGESFPLFHPFSSSLSSLPPPLSSSSLHIILPLFEKVENLEFLKE